jgi:protein SCO1/2
MSPATAGRARTHRVRRAFVAALILACALGTWVLVGARREAQDPLPVLGRVADFALVDQTSAPVSRAAFAGDPWIANFVFTRCPLVCPRITERMRAVQTLARRSGGPLRLVTFSVDPEHDEPAVLKSYADAHGADHERWTFLTGSASSIEEVARSFSVALEGEADPSRSDFGIMHSGHLVLVDGRGRIRRYYPSGEEGVEYRILVDLTRLDAS